MQRLPDVFRRNRTLIVLFAMLVILPVGFLGYLGLRAIRSEGIEKQVQQRDRQRQIAQLVNNHLKDWLFSQRSDGAVSQAFLRFTVDRDRLSFPDFPMSIPPKRPSPLVPVDPAKSDAHPDGAPDYSEAIPSARDVEELYSPRIRFFLRDFRLGQNPGAQYFRRLNAMIVQIPGTANGYLLRSSRLIEFARRKLDEMTPSEDFRGLLQIDEPGEPAFRGEDVVSLNDFPFFHIAFAQKEGGISSFRRNALIYSTILLTVMTLLGGLFVFRAISYEVAVAELQAEFVSAVSHEFRTPLSSMLALLERIESGKVVEKEMLGNYHQMLRQEARRLAMLVDKLLNFAQIEAGKKKLSFETVDLDEIIEEATRALHQSRVPCQVEHVRDSPAAPVVVSVDRTAVVHCIQNLVDNALKYSSPGTPVVVRSDRHEGAPMVEVIDHGIGIAARDQQKIFDKFYRADNARSWNVHGVGIGLSLVRRIMEEHCGSVTVVSAPGTGSCFRLVFPKQEDRS